MLKKLSVPALGIAAGFAVLLSPGVLSVSQAQEQREIRLGNFRIQIGPKQGNVQQILNQQGFDQIEVVQSDLRQTIARACRNGQRLQIYLDRRGRIRGTEVVGNCRNELNRDQIARKLEDRGYSRLKIDEQNGYYVGIGCIGDQRVRARMTRYGDLRDQRAIGACKQELSPADIVAQLRDAGLNRIEMVDRDLPEYVARACREGERLELKLDRFGIDTSQRVVGTCPREIDPRSITRALQQRGYEQIDIVDNELPKYVAEACYSGRKFRVTLNRYGEVGDRERLGRCRTALSSEQLVAALSEEGFKRLRVTEENAEEVSVTGCFDDEKIDLRLNRYGNILDERQAGRCTERSIAQIAQYLRGRDVSKLSFYAEGCQRGERLRLRYNQFGDRTNLEVIGDC